MICSVTLALITPFITTQRPRTGHSPSLMAKNGRSSPNTRLTVNNGHALVEAALAGGGIIRASELAVARYLATGRLVPILSEFASGDRPMHIVYPGQRIRLPKLRAFVDWAIKSIPSNG